jgi:hypothetical protein
MELRFINIKPNYRTNPEDMVKDIVAVKLNGQFYPLEEPDAKEVFIYGTGWKRIAKAKRYTILRFSMRTEDWNTYRERYGDRVLYFSLTNDNLNSGDCCGHCARQEFYSIRNLDLERYMGFVQLWERFNELQQKRLKEIYWFDTTGWICERHSMWPSFGWGPISFLPSMDPIRDDKTIWNCQCQLFHDRCEKEGIKISLTHLELGFDNPEFDNIMKDFPVSVHDRMLHVFGEEMTNIYQQLLDYYVDGKE